MPINPPVDAACIINDTEETQALGKAVTEELSWCGDAFDLYLQSGNKQRIKRCIERADANVHTAGATAHNLRYAVKGGDCK